ncbi:Aste57867_13466 [Aphanomyces stellatus]|uniref:Aste57867_13466 protein n=1 Tax=Aphanomyces stellatus TaxID=120398 RepID=A0A485KZ30_9STRA|nr:hypothetical protein As57867_013416 [Aphanomyces stellatus]VFT90304.1 Aste57867_13466 [Aphanomyces stellatus]
MVHGTAMKCVKPPACAIFGVAVVVMGAVATRAEGGILAWFFPNESTAIKRKEAIWGCSLLAPLYSFRSLTSLAVVSNEVVLTPKSTKIIPDDMQLIFIYSGHITATVVDLGTVSFVVDRTSKRGGRKLSLTKEQSLANRLRLYAVDREHVTEEVMLCRRQGNATYLLRFVASKIRSREVVVKSLLVSAVEVKSKTRAIALPPIVPSNPKGTTWGRFNAIVPLVHRRTSELVPDAGHVPITADCATILQRSPYFGEIGAMDLRRLADMGTISIVQEDTVVMQEREDGGHEMFVVLTGDLRVCVRDQTTKVLKPVATLHSGSCMGEMTLLLRGPRTATVTAISDCLLVSVERATLMSFLKRHPIVEAHLQRMLLGRLLQNIVTSNAEPLFSAFQYTDVMALVPHCFVEDRIGRGTVLYPVDPTNGERRKFRILLTGTLETIHPNSGSTFAQSGHVGDLLDGMEPPLAPATRIVASSGECSFLSMYTDLCLAHLDALALAEARIRWGQADVDVEHILKHPPARQFYMRYLTSEFSEENLLFVIAVQAFKWSPTAVADAHAIVAEYILESAPKQVNVEAKMRVEILTALPRLEPDDHTIFDKAVDEITKLMRKDSFPRFKKTVFFRDMLAVYPRLDHRSQGDIHEGHDASASTPTGDPISEIGKRFDYVLKQVMGHREKRRELVKAPSVPKLASQPSQRGGFIDVKPTKRSSGRSLGRSTGKQHSLRSHGRTNDPIVASYRSHGRMNDAPPATTQSPNSPLATTTTATRHTIAHVSAQPPIKPHSPSITKLPPLATTRATKAAVLPGANMLLQPSDRSQPLTEELPTGEP